MKFDRIALVLGFVVDSFAIISIVMAIKISNVSINLPGYISPGLAFTIWLIAGYTYLGLLHRYWENYDEFSKNSFGNFIFVELAFHFKKPLLLFPGFILVVLLFWISSSSESRDIYNLLLGVFLIIIFFIMIIARILAADSNKNQEEVTQEHKDKINANWDFLKERITLKLEKNQWLKISDFDEVTDIWEIPTDTMHYAFSKYAFEYPEDVEYCYLYRNEDNKPVGFGRVLVNIDSINEDLYWYSS